MARTLVLYDLVIAAVAVGVFWLPGVALARMLHIRAPADWPAHVVVQLSLGLAFWPILFLATSLTGWHWTSASARLASLLLASAGAWVLVSTGRNGAWQRTVRARRFHLATFALLLIAAFGLRLLHIRSLALPPWVDSVHHAMLVRLLVEQGAVPATLSPFVPDGLLFYHWGYHLLVAWTAWIMGATDASSIAQLMLHLGQIFNAMHAASLYLLGFVLLRSRRAALLAAALGVFVSWHPAYYLSWGRYPQLVGLLLLPAICSLALTLRRRPALGVWTALVILLTGSLLIHVRTSVFALVFVALVIGATAITALRRPLLRRDYLRSAGAGLGAVAAAFALITPWLMRLGASPRFENMVLTTSGPRLAWQRAFNAMPWEIIWSPHNVELLSLASGGLSGVLGWGPVTSLLRGAAAVWLTIIVLAAGSALLRNRTQTGVELLRVFGITLVWSLLIAAATNLERVGLPALGFLNNSANAITLFVPLSILGGGLLAWVLAQFTPPAALRPATLALLLLLVIFGFWQMHDIVNPSTVLARSRDLAAYAWIRTETTPDAAFAINVARWQGNTFIGYDGGYWVQVLTDRRTILPPSLYATAWPPERSAELNAFMELWGRQRTVDDPAILRELRKRGVTHLYVGGDSGHLDSTLLDQSAHVRLVFSQGKTRIYALVDAEPSLGE